MHENGTWELVERPPNVKPVPCKWVFKVKRNKDGSVERFKAIHVACTCPPTHCCSLHAVVMRMRWACNALACDAIIVSSLTAARMSNLATEDALRKFLAARGVSPGEDVTVTASNVLATLVAEAAAKRPAFVSNPADLKDQLLVFATAEEAFKNNPFKNPKGNASITD